MYKLEPYQTESGNVPLEKFLSEVSKSGNVKELSKIQVYIQRLSLYGMGMNKHFPESIKNIKDEIYELRPGRNRILFFSITADNKFVLLHGFKKKTQKTPKKEIEKAEQELKDFKRRCM